MTPQFLKWFADTYPATAAAAERGESGPLRDRRNDWDVWSAATVPTPPPMRSVPLVPPTTEYRRVLPGESDLGMVAFVAVVMAMGFLFGYVARGGGL